MTWIQTNSGRIFDLLEPHPDAIDIEDIAQALSNLARFTGHTDFFYSVAQHSVLVSTIVSPAHALIGLMHDATEAYVGDVARPLKALLPDYKLIEHRVWLAIAEKFDLPAEIPAEVKHADNVALMTERRDLMKKRGRGWIDWSAELEALPTLPIVITPDLPRVARGSFIDRFIQLTREAA